MRKKQGFQVISKPWNNIAKNITKKANDGNFLTNLSVFHASSAFEAQMQLFPVSKDPDEPSEIQNQNYVADGDPCRRTLYAEASKIAMLMLHQVRKK
jgi:hypothetical protein